MKRGRHDDVGIVAGLRQSVPQRPCCSCTWGGAPWFLSFYAREASRSLALSFPCSPPSSQTNVASSSFLLVVSILFFLLPLFLPSGSFFAPFLFLRTMLPLSATRTLFLLFALALHFSQSRFFVASLSARAPSPSGVADRTCVTGDVI